MNMRGKLADRNAWLQHQARLNPEPPPRYVARTFALRFTVSGEVMSGGHYFNLSKPWYLSNGRRGGLRRRKVPYVHGC